MPNPFRSDFVIGGGGPGIGGIYDAAGRFIKGGQTFCLPPMPAECVSEYGRGAYNLEILQPASRYWLFQGIETPADNGRSHTFGTGGGRHATATCDTNKGRYLLELVHSILLVTNHLIES